MKNKRTSVFYWLKKQKVDMILLQETHCGSKKDSAKWSDEWGIESYWTTESSNSQGVALLFTEKHDMSDKVVIKSSRIIYVDIQLEDDEDETRIINVYAPNRGRDRKKFFKVDLQNAIQGRDKTIIGGDYNCTLKNIDRSKMEVNDYEEGRKELQEVIKESHLEDVFRRRYPTKLAYTYHKPTGEQVSRIDMWLISTEFDHKVTEIKAVYGPVPDHKAIVLKMDISEVKRGNGIWKMNNRIIQTEMFKNTFNQFWNTWREKKQGYRSTRLWWEESKRKIKELAIWCSKKMKEEENERRKVLEERLQKQYEQWKMAKEEINEM